MHLFSQIWKTKSHKTKAVTDKKKNTTGYGNSTYDFHGVKTYTSKKPSLLSAKFSVLFDFSVAFMLF